MNWYTKILSGGNTTAKMEEIMDIFLRAFILLSTPENMALFVYGETLYFSPACLSLVPDLLENLGATISDPPACKLSLLVGQQSALENYRSF